MTLTYTTLPAPQNISLPDTFTLDNRKIPSEAAFRGTRYSDRLFYTDDRAELNILLSSLLASDDMPKAAFKTESPDFRIVLKDDTEIHVEVTTAIASSEARADNVIMDLSYALSRWLENTPEADLKLHGYALSFQIPYPPKSSQTDAALKEMQQFVFDANLENLAQTQCTSIHAKYKQLSDLNAKVICQHCDSTFIQVSRGAICVEAPQDSARIVYDAIERKSRLASSWPRPIWLIVWISGLYYSPDRMLEKLRLNESNIEPFSRVYIGGGRSVLVITVDST